MMAKLTKRQLNDALHKLAVASSKAVLLQAMISEHCIEVYGVEPGDVDNDEFIDRVAGGCGVAAGMTADEFDRSMRECIARNQSQR